MPQSNHLKLAKQGNAKALAAMLNQSLQPKSITAKVGRKDDCLQILLESAQTPDQEAIVSFIRNGLIKLEVESIKTVKVYGRQTGEESPAWSQQFEIVSQPENVSSTEESDFNNLLTHQTPPKTPRLVPPKVETETPSSTEQTHFQNPRRSSASAMSPSSHQPMGVLSLGNVVSAGLRIYRDHFKLYYGLAFTAYLWIILPIYGWAKFAAILALISRLAFSELIERPETVDQARRHVMPRMWNFLGAGILVVLILLGASIGAAIVFGILARVLGAILGQSTGLVIGFILLGVSAVVTLIAGYLWLLCHLYIVEVPLAIEDNLNAISAIGRSWKLTGGFVLRLVLIVIVAFLLTIPVSIVVQIVTSIFQSILTVVLPTNSPTFVFVNFLGVVVLSFASGALLIPFWQAIKAVIYYDLRNRREGLGLEMRASR
jgi:hypothetical protein